MYMQLHKVNSRQWEARLNGKDYLLRGTKTPHSSKIVWVALRVGTANELTQVGIASGSFQSALEFAMEDTNV